MCSFANGSLAALVMRPMNDGVSRVVDSDLLTLMVSPGDNTLITASQ
jgi:hypothetical protein